MTSRLGTPHSARTPAPRVVPASGSGASEGWAALSTLLGGLALYGGIGYGLDRLFGVPVLLPIGLVVGLVLAVYGIYARSGGRPERDER